MQDGRGRTITQEGNWFCPFHDNRDTPALSVFIGDGGRLFYKCHNASCGKTGLVDGNAGGKPEGARRRPFRLTSYARTLTRKSEPPKPIAARLDSTLRGIAEALDAPEQDFLDAMKNRGLTLEACRLHHVAFGSWAWGNQDWKELGAWLLPVQEGGRTVAVKVHREQPAFKPKSGWLPLGERNLQRKTRHGLDTLFPSPEAYDRKATLVLCPGELKALACLSAGFNATSKTAGETAWQARQLARLKGFPLVVLFDEDEAGRAFMHATVKRLKHHCPSLKAVTFGLGTDGKRLDANDIAKAEGQDGLRRRLEASVSITPELAEKDFDLGAFRLEMRAQMGRAMDAPSGFHVFSGIVGCGKSVMASELATERSEERFAFVCPTHELALEYCQRIPGALRLLSPDRMTKEGTECEWLSAAKALQSRGYSYSGRLCKPCGSKASCPCWQAKTKAKEARVLVLQHSHLKHLQPGWLDGRTVIIDEDCIPNLSWRESFPQEDLADFALMVKRNYPFAWSSVSPVACRLLELPAGQSLEPEAMSLLRIPPEVLAHWHVASGRLGADTSGKNLLPVLAKASFMRREKDWTDKDGKRHEGQFWAVLGASLDATQKPVLILDATASRPGYEELLGKGLSYFPESQALPCPKSAILQFVDGMYPAKSLVQEAGRTEGKTDWKATPSLERIVDHLKRVCKDYDHGKGLDWKDLGVITLKKAVEPLHHLLPELPTENILHYGSLRGLNVLQDCKVLAIIGCQPCKPRDLAATVATIFGLDEDLETLLKNADFGKGFAELDEWYETEQPTFKDKRFQAAWEMTVTSEIVQAIGRARPYETREKQQGVLLYCNLQLPMPTDAWTMDGWLHHLGLKSPSDELDERLEKAALKLSRYQPFKLDANEVYTLYLAFGLEELCAELGMAPTTFKQHAKYGRAMDAVAARLGLRKTTGHGKDRAGLAWTPIQLEKEET